MKQQRLGLGQLGKRTRRRDFLDAMERVVRWSELVGLVAPFIPERRRGCPPFPVQAMLRIHFMQQWFNLSDPAMEDALHDVPLLRDFVGLGGRDDPLPDESSALRFLHILEPHLMLKSGTGIDATMIAAPSSTKNSSGDRYPEMKQSKRGQQWCFGMTCHITAEAESGLVHTVRGTAGSVADGVQANSLLHGSETDASGDAGYQGARKRPDANRDVT